VVAKGGRVESQWHEDEQRIGTASRGGREGSDVVLTVELAALCRGMVWLGWLKSVGNKTGGREGKRERSNGLICWWMTGNRDGKTVGRRVGQ